MAAYDAFLLKLLCRRGGTLEPTQSDIARFRAEGAGDKVLSFLTYRNQRNINRRSINPCTVVNVVLADFYDVDTRERIIVRPDVTSEIRKELLNLSRVYPDINVISLGKPITEETSRFAIEGIGRDYDAGVVIWGNVTQLPQVTKVTAWVETLKMILPVNPSVELVGARGALDHLEIQGEIARHLRAMVLLIMGEIRRSAYDSDAAIGFYSSVLEQRGIPSDIAFQAQLLRARVTLDRKMFLSYGELRDLRDEVEDALKINPTSSSAHLLLLKILSRLDTTKAITQGNLAIQTAATTEEKIDAYLGFATFYGEYGDRTGVETNTKNAIGLIQTKPQTVSTRLDLIRCFRLLKDSAQAESQIRAVIAMIDADGNSSASDYLMQGIIATFINRYDLMEQSLIKALEVNPNLIQARVALSAYFWELGNTEKQQNRKTKANEYYRKALEHANRAIERDPTMIEALMFRAQIYRFMDRVEESAADYKWALRLDPGYRTANIALASLYADRGKYDSALKYISDAITIREDPMYFNERGMYYLAVSKQESALADFIKCDQLMRLDISELMKGLEGNRANRYGLEDAVEVFNKQIDLLRERREVDAALILTNNVIDLYGDYGFFHRLKAALLYEKAKNGSPSAKKATLQEAIKEVNKAIAAEPGTARYYMLRAEMLVDSDDYSAAKHDVERAIELDGRKVSYFVFMAMIDIHNHDDEAAIKDLESAILVEEDAKKKAEWRDMIEEIRKLQNQETH